MLLSRDKTQQVRGTLQELRQGFSGPFRERGLGCRRLAATTQRVFPGNQSLLALPGDSGPRSERSLIVFDLDESRTFEGISYRADLHLSTQPVLIDYFPWANRSFRVSLGVAFNQNELTGTASPALGTSFTIGPTTYVAAAGDRVDVEISQQPVSAYLSLGGNFFYFDDAHHWAFGGEIGVLFTGDADVNLTASGQATAADLASERRQLQDSADELPLWPVLKLGISARF